MPTFQCWSTEKIIFMSSSRNQGKTQASPSNGVLNIFSPIDFLSIQSYSLIPSTQLTTRSIWSTAGTACLCSMGNPPELSCPLFSILKNTAHPPSETAENFLCNLSLYLQNVSVSSLHFCGLRTLSASHTLFIEEELLGDEDFVSFPAKDLLCVGY